MNLTNQKVSGINEISLQDSLNAAALGLKIKVGADTVAPEGNELIVYVDKESSSNQTSDRKQYVFNLNSPLKSIGEVSDELIQVIDVKNNESKLKTYVKRNIESNDSGDYVVSQSTLEDLESIDVTLFEGTNYIYTNYSNAEITIVYPKDDDLNRMFLNSSIYNRHRELNNEISSNDIYFKDAFSKMGEELNEEVDNLSVKCITSKNNKFSLDSEGNLIVNSITTNSSSSSESNVNQDVMRDFIYPVGSIYMSVNNVDPANLFGGSWEQIKDKFLLASGDIYSNGTIGGESSHVLSASELPKHSHGIPALSGATNGAGAHSHSVNGTSANNGGSGVLCETWANKSNDRNGSTSGVGNHTHTVTTNASTTNETGNNDAHNNMPPYLTINIWKRIN